MKPVLIVGAGFSGAVVARQLAEAGCPSVVIDQRAHVAGNCHTSRDSETGVMQHVYGPHIFHTDDKGVWAFVNQYTEMMPYTLRIKTTVGGRVYSMPINLHTLNQYFGRAMSPTEARDFIGSKQKLFLSPPQTFEEQALSMVGVELYEAFFKGYTEKQWGVSPKELPASILKRLPMRFSYDDNYFAHSYQGIPRDGYTRMVENMLDHDLIQLHLNTGFEKEHRSCYAHTFYSGAIDGYFGYREGLLGYRTLDFKHHRVAGDYQGTALMNYGEREVPYTRITEHKHFAPWEIHEKTLYTREYSRLATVDDIPFYPIRLAEEKQQLTQYLAMVEQERDITFMGRLGTYRYLDMDVTIREALDTAKLYMYRR